jgi:acetoin utilization deacetylase AcuC-like enzyme
MVLEGGYNLEALGACVVGALRVLLQHEPEKDPLGTITAREPDVSGLIAHVRKNHTLLAGA